MGAHGADARHGTAHSSASNLAPPRVALARPAAVDRYNIVSEDDLRMAAQKTTMYLDTLPTTRILG